MGYNLAGNNIIDRIISFLKRRLNPCASSLPKISSDYALLGKIETSKADGWQLMSVAELQHQTFELLLQDARKGKARLDFQVAAQAVNATGMDNPLIIEIGCGSGYYSEVFSILLDRPVQYAGIDYAKGMTSLAHQIYPNVPFITGDACQLPLKTAVCDVLFNGTSLMHIIDYSQAIAESVRVSRKWCIFHTVPVMTGRSTTFLSKRAYGESVIEVIFNQAELETLFSKHGLAIQTRFESIPYDVSVIVGERTCTLTYLCKKAYEGFQ